MISEQEEFITYAELIGKCGGEKYARDAIRREDVEVRKITDRNGKKLVMYKMLRISRPQTIKNQDFPL